LITGRWDTTAELLADPGKIAQTVSALPYFGSFA
jgi:hypothetical protein